MIAKKQPRKRKSQIHQELRMIDELPAVMVRALRSRVDELQAQATKDARRLKAQEERIRVQEQRIRTLEIDALRYRHVVQALQSRSAPQLPSPPSVRVKDGRIRIRFASA